MTHAADFLRESDLAWWVDADTPPTGECAGAVTCKLRRAPAGNASPSACALLATCGMPAAVAAGEAEWQTVQIMGQRYGKIVAGKPVQAPLTAHPEAAAPEMTPEESAFWDRIKARTRADLAEQARRRTIANLVRGSHAWNEAALKRPPSEHLPKWGGTRAEWEATRPTMARVALAVQDLCERAPRQWAPAIRRLANLPRHPVAGVVENHRTKHGDVLRVRREWDGAMPAMEALAEFDAEHGDALAWVLSDEDIRERAGQLAQMIADAVARIYRTHGVSLREADAARERIACHEAFTQATTGKTAGQVMRETGRQLAAWARTDAMGAADMADANALLIRLATAMREAVDFVAHKCRVHQVEVPQLARRVVWHEAVRGAIARAQDAKWWRRQLRKSAARIVEAGAIKLGMVNKRAGGYCSDWALQQRRDQLKRNAASLANTVMANEAGQLYTLAELAAASVSNPANRGGELMTRIRGCEEYADAAGHVGLFLTLTCPSAMHRMLSKEWRDKGDTRNTADAYKARKNPKYDGTSTPRSAQKWLVKQWAKARAALARKKLHIYGFRVAEPHHDGTPHWHALVWSRDEAEAEKVQEVLSKYWVENDKDYADEQGADEYRTNFKRMKRGGAAGYIAKYIAKSIGHHNLAEHMDTSGAGGDLFTVEMGQAHGQGHERVDAWASRWGIRQFQAIGQPSVTVWREMRRVTQDQIQNLSRTDVPAQLAWRACQKIGEKAADWAAYLNALGGTCLRRDQYRLQPACRVARRANGYGETQDDRKVVGVVAPSGKWLVSRRQVWRPLDGRESSQAKSRIQRGETPQDEALRTACGAPWTGFNNCTARLRVGRANELWAESEALAKGLKQAEDDAWMTAFLGASDEDTAQAALLHARAAEMPLPAALCWARWLASQLRHLHTHAADQIEAALGTAPRRYAELPRIAVAAPQGPTTEEALAALRARRAQAAAEKAAQLAQAGDIDAAMAAMAASLGY